MNHLSQISLLALTSLALASMAPAQTYKYTTLPPGYDTKDTLGYSYVFGWQANGRTQHADNSLRGKIHILMGADCRLRKNYYYSTYNGMGRTWSKVKLGMSNCELDKLTNTFSSNVLGPQTEVFNAKVTWSTVAVGRTTTNPFGQVAFPFARAFFYLGKQDLLFDYQFSGGTLTNNLAWGTYGRYYYLEGVPYQSTTAYLRTTYVPAPPSGTSGNKCNDSAWTYSYGAYVYAYGTVYGDNYSTTSYRRTFYFTHYTRYTAPWAPMMQVLSLGGTDTGINVGASCNKLHVDLTKVIHTTLQITDLFGSTGYINLNGQYNGYPYDPGLGGLDLYIQGAWTDSKTKRLSLTIASKVPLPELPGLRRRMVVYESSGKSYLTSYSTYSPLYRLWHK